MSNFRKGFNRVWDYTVIPIVGLVIGGPIGFLIGIGVAALIDIARNIRP